MLKNVNFDWWYECEFLVDWILTYGPDSDLYYSEISSTGAEIVGIEDLEIEDRWDWRLDDEFAMNLVISECLIVYDDMMK
jgi:hypothetical protein